eukprot:g11576.t1
MFTRISVVDLAGGELKVAQALSDAFADTGFAVITSSGIPSSTVAELRAAALEWFQSPVEVKQKANAGASEGYGHSPYCRMEENGAQLLGDFSKPNDLVESLTSPGRDGLMLPHSPRLEAASQFEGSPAMSWSPFRQPDEAQHMLAEANDLLASDRRTSELRPKGDVYRLETGSVYGSSIAFPQLARCSGYNKVFVFLWLRAWMGLALNFFLQMQMVVFVGHLECS